MLDQHPQHMHMPGGGGVPRTRRRKYARASSVCRVVLAGQSASCCRPSALRRPAMKLMRGQGGVKSISTGSSSGPSARQFWHLGLMRVLSLGSLAAELSIWQTKQSGGKKVPKRGML